MTFVFFYIIVKYLKQQKRVGVMSIQSFVNHVLEFVLEKIETTDLGAWSKDRDMYEAITKDILKSWEIAPIHKEYFIDDSAKHYQVFKNVISQINQDNKDFDIDDIETWLPNNQNLALAIGDHEFKLDIDWRESLGDYVGDLPNERSVALQYNLETALQEAGLSGGYDFEDHKINILIPYLELFDVPDKDKEFVRTKNLFTYLNSVESIITLVHEGRHASDSKINTKQEVISSKENNLKEFNIKLDEYLKSNIKTDPKVEYCSLFNESSIPKVVKDAISYYIQVNDIAKNLTRETYDHVQHVSIPKSRGSASYLDEHYKRMSKIIVDNFPYLNELARLHNYITLGVKDTNDINKLHDSILKKFCLDVKRNKKEEDLHELVVDMALGLATIDTLYSMIDYRIRENNKYLNVFNEHPIKTDVNHRTHMTFPSFEENSYRVEDVLEVIKNGLLGVRTSDLLYMQKQTLRLPFGNSTKDYDVLQNINQKVVRDNIRHIPQKLIDSFDKYMEYTLDFLESNDYTTIRDDIERSTHSSSSTSEESDKLFYYGRESFVMIVEMLSKVVQDVVNHSLSIGLLKLYSQDIIDTVLFETYIKNTIFETNANYFKCIESIIKSNRKEIISEIPNDDWIYNLNYIITQRMEDRTLYTSLDYCGLKRISRDIKDIKKYCVFSDKQLASPKKIMKTLNEYIEKIEQSNISNITTIIRLNELIEELGGSTFKTAIKKVKERYQTTDQDILEVITSICSLHDQVFKKELKRLYANVMPSKNIDSIALPLYWLDGVEFKKPKDLYVTLTYFAGFNTHLLDDDMLSLAVIFSMKNVIKFIGDIHELLRSVSNSLILDEYNSNRNKALLTTACVYMNFLLSELTIVSLSDVEQIDSK